MEKEKNEESVIIFNTPQGLDLSLLFGDISIKFKPKAEFIIHQANYYHKAGGYQMHSKNHQWFFGIKGTELALITRRLVDAGIIELATNYNPGNRSKTYRMVKPFDIANAQKSFYHVNDITFLQKWVMDGYIVKNAGTSKFKKERNGPKTTIAAQEKEIDRLKQQLIMLSARLNSDSEQHSEDINKESELPEMSSTVSEITEHASSHDDNKVDVFKETKESSVAQFGDLTAEPYDNTMCIFYGDEIGCIENFEDIEDWCLQLSTNERQRFYHQLMTQKVDKVTYFVNKYTVASFKRTVDVGGITFTYTGMAAA